MIETIYFIGYACCVAMFYWRSMTTGDWAEMASFWLLAGATWPFIVGLFVIIFIFSLPLTLMTRVKTGEWIWFWEKM